MSDWRSRAKPVSDWRSRATPVVAKEAVAEEAPSGQFSDTESALAGAAQGFGYEILDELYGARRGAQDVLLGDSKLTDLPDRYRARRQEARDYYNQAQEENPVSYGAGNIGGAGAAAFVPGYNLARGGRAVGAAVSSGVAGLGASDKESVIGNIEDAGKSAAGGALLSQVGRVLPSAKGIKKFANEKAVKASGAMTKEMRQLNKSGLMDAQGDFLLKNKIVTPFASLEDVAERSGNYRKKAGSRIGLIIDNVDRLRQQVIDRVSKAYKTQPQGEAQARGFAKIVNDEFGYNFNNVAGRIRGIIGRDDRIAASKFHREKLSTLADEFERIGAGGSGTLREGLSNKTQHRRLLKDVDNLGEDYKQEIYDIISEELERGVANTERLQAGALKLSKSPIPAAAPGSTSPRLPEAGRKLPPKDAGDISPRDALEVPPRQTARPVADPEIQKRVSKTVDNFKQANREYAASAVAEKTAQNRLGNVQSNRDFGLTTAIASAAGLVSGGAPAAVAMGAWNNFARKYGATTLATSANRVAKILQAQPQAFGKYSGTLEEAMRRGPRQFMLTTYLIGKSDPQFATFLEQLMQGDNEP